MKTSYPTLRTLALLLCLFIPTTAWGQDAPTPPATPDAGAAAPVVQVDCKDALLTLADRGSLGLRTLLGKMNPAQVHNVLQWSDCDTPSRGLETVYEHAVREHDGKGLAGPGAVKLYISPSQSLEVSDPEGAFARRELVDKVRQVPEARDYTARALGGTLGALTWRATLADLNAHTHALEAHIALGEQGLAQETRRGRDLAASLLVATSYVSHAKQAHPMVFTRLSSSAVSVDALGLLIKRAEETLARAGDLAPETRAIIKSVHAQGGTLRELFASAGVRMPTLRTKLAQAPAAPVVVVKTPQPDAEDPKPSDDEPIKVTAVPAKVEDPAQDNPELAKPKEETPEPAKAQAPPAKNPEPAEPDAKKTEPGEPDAAKPDAAKPQADGDPAPKDKESPTEAPEAQEPQSELGFQVRMGVLITLVLFPWLWLGVLAFLKRRKDKTRYLSLANRTLAMATLLLVIVSLVLAAFGAAGSMSTLATWDSVVFAFPLYWLVVSLLMLRKLDSEAQLASRHLMRRWAKWGGLFLGVVLVANVIVLLLVPPVAQFVMSPSFAVVGIVAIVFLIKLWRTGNIDPDAPPAQETPADGEGAPKPVAPKAGTPPAPKAAPKPAAEPVTVKPTPAAAPAPSDVPDDFGLFDDAPEATGQDEISDEDFAAQLDAMETDAGGSPDEIPEDRAELYRLLGGDDKS